MTVTLDQLLSGIRAQESGGNYRVVNSIGATGAYQVMPANIGPWTQAALGHPLTQAQFLASPTAQDAVARHVLGQYYAKYGAAGAAAMWYSGQPDPASTASSPGAPTVAQYVAQVLAKAGGTSPSNSSSGTTTAGLSIPAPNLWGDLKPVLFYGAALLGGAALVVTGATLASGHSPADLAGAGLKSAALAA